MKEFEREIIIEFLKQTSFDISSFHQNNYEEEIEFSTSSYRLKLKNIGTDLKHYFSDKSSFGNKEIFGKLDGIDVGFSIIIQANDLTLECYSNHVEITEKNRNSDFERIKT